MKTPNKNNSPKKIKSLNILYDRLNKIIKNKKMNSFGLILFSFDLTKLNPNYSERIKLVNDIVSYLNKYLEKEDELYQLEKDKILIFTKNENLKKYTTKLYDKLEKNTFKINNEIEDDAWGILSDIEEEIEDTSWLYK